MVKRRVDVNIEETTKQQLDAVIARELEEDRIRDRPERSRSEITDMVIRKGLKALLFEYRAGIRAKTDL